MGWLDTQSNAGLRIIGSRGHSHVILISSWPRHFFRGTHNVRNNFGSIFNYIF